MSHFNFSRFRIHPATVWVYCGVLQGVTDEHHEDGRLSFKEFEREMIRGVWFQSNSWVVLINCPCIISIHFVHIRWVTSWCICNGIYQQILCTQQHPLALWLLFVELRLDPSIPELFAKIRVGVSWPFHGHEVVWIGLEGRSFNISSIPWMQMVLANWT